MTKLKHRKLLDVWGKLEDAEPVHGILQRYLTAHEISFRRVRRIDPYNREFHRYYVDATDLSSAQAVLPALREMQGDRIKKASV